MIPTQSLETFPVFGDNATKVQPDNGGAKYSNGFQQSDVLPAEWLNWEWNKASSAVTALNAGVSSVESELNNVLTEAGISPSGSATNQVYKAIKKTNGCVMASSKTITGAPNIEAGSSIKIMFTADITGNNTTDALVISYNGTGCTVKANKNGSLADVKAHELATGSYKYIQAYTTIDFVYDGTYLVIVGNPVVLEGIDFKVYANGKIGDEFVADVKPRAAGDVPYGWLECNGQSILRASYPDLFTKIGTTYGSVDSDHFNVPDYREIALVGIGTNGTDTVVDHDSFTLGEFKNDQLQSHTHEVTRDSGVFLSTLRGSVATGDIQIARYTTSAEVYAGTINNGRKGTVTRGKSKGVNYIIKAL